MTAARQERKSRPAAIVAGLGAALILAIAAGLAPDVLRAAPSELVVSNRHTGLAIDGFDPVAYFVDATPRAGIAGLELRAAGGIWRFHNEGNRAAFEAHPEVYAPRFGGYDPVAVGRGVATAGNPMLWLVENQRLYLFYDAKARAAFARNPAAAVSAAERQWPAVQRTLAR